MNAPPLPVVLEPALVEEVVLRAIAGRAEEQAFRRARNRVYALDDGDERERAFATLHDTWFARLELQRPIILALAELPILHDHCSRCLVTRARTRDDEGADLLVAEDEASASQRTVLIRLRATAFADPDGLLNLLRAELLHVADMVEPAFGYEPALPAADGGPAYEQLLRDRYRVLWDVSVAGRLVRRGVAAPEARATARHSFVAAFPMLEGNAEEAFARFFNGAACTHAELVTFAAAPRACDAHPGLGPGGRCPLCRFPTYAPEPAPEGLPANVIQHLLADFPTWRPAHGICRQCADLYRARGVAPGADCTSQADAQDRL